MRVYTIAILIPFLFSCTEKKADPPKDVLTETQLIEVLTDIRLLEGAYSILYRQVDTSSTKIDSYYKKLLSEKSITREQFEKSYSYYASQDGKLPVIENAVIERLSQMQAEEESKQ